MEKVLVLGTSHNFHRNPEM